MQKRTGRPPKYRAPMMTPITIRLPVEMHRLIERMVKDRSLDGADKATVIRELIAEAIATRGAR